MYFFLLFKNYITRNNCQQSSWVAFLTEEQDMNQYFYYSQHTCLHKQNIINVFHLDFNASEKNIQTVSGDK